MGIYFKEVSHSYFGNTSNHAAISNINLSVLEKNEFICLIGHTGSGKSTLALHMNALLFPTSGEVQINGSTVTKKRNKKVNYNQLRKHVGVVFQFPEYQLFEETVIKDVMFGPLNFKMSVDQAQRLSKDALKLVGLNEEYYNKKPFNLSGGEKKRVSIAGILAMNPDILILDEPTSGLDPLGKRDVMNLLKSIQKETQKSIIVITHDMDLVYEYANRVIVMNAGELAFDGSPDALFRRDDLTKLSLTLPSTVKTLIALNERFSLDMNPYQKSVDEALLEIRRVMN